MSVAVCAEAVDDPVRLDFVVDAEATIPTRHGAFRFIVFRQAEDFTKKHVALDAGNVRGDDVLVRVHSECMTAEVFGSLKCDCAEQLDCALATIAKQGRGVVLYLRQEGRSIGLANKIARTRCRRRGPIPSMPTAHSTCPTTRDATTLRRCVGDAAPPRRSSRP